jgi:hypothetical protein
MYFVVRDIKFGIPARIQIQKMAYCPPLEGFFLQKEQRLKELSQICFVAIFGFYEQEGIGSAAGLKACPNFSCPHTFGAANN